VTLPNGTVITYDYSGLEGIMKKLKGKHVKIISDGVTYGKFWELGHTTPSGAILQKPFLVPACEQMREPMKKAIQQAVNRGDLKTMDVIIDKVAFDVEKRAKQIIVELPLVDTAALLNSIAVHDPEGF